MTGQEIKTGASYTKSIRICAPALKVWTALTNPELMKQWMAEEKIEIITDWKIESSIFIQGTAHWVYFENKGTVLQFDPEKTLQYSHLSSLSKLSDEPQNYSLITFSLEPVNDQTELTLTLTNFPTESIYRHLVFYWSVTLEIIKKFVE